MPVLDQEFLTNGSFASAPRLRWNTEQSALAVESLGRSGFLRLRVHGESMLPTLWPGDVVEIARCSLEEVRPGDVVLAQRDGRFFLHRLVAADDRGFVLCGDSMPGSDPGYPPKAMLGRLTGVVEGGRSRSRATPGHGVGAMWSRGLGLVLCHCGIVRRLALNLRRTTKAGVPEFRKNEPVASSGSAQFGA